jgi:HPt (histidine-containing phosphotransfer) domain-containing protein
MKPILEIDVLTELKELSPENPRAFLQELADTFQKQARSDLNALQAFVRESKWLEASKRAHSLKSGSGQLGAARVAEICNLIETLTRSEKADPSIALLVTELVEAYETTEKELLTYLSSK